MKKVTVILKGGEMEEFLVERTPDLGVVSVGIVFETNLDYRFYNWSSIESVIVSKHEEKFNSSTEA